MRNKNIQNLPDTESVAVFRKGVTGWYDKHKRVYPWRTTRDPFKILVAEMMLRRTRADQVKAVYNRLIKEYPDAGALARASNKKLSSILYSIGLRWRTPSFKLMARVLNKKYKSRVPRTREELKTLPGIGDYVAGAILSIAFNRKEWIVDSNIVRIFNRYFGVRGRGEEHRDKNIISIAKKYVSVKKPKKANLALLDFATLLCRPRQPLCKSCPLIDTCNCFPADSKGERQKGKKRRR